MTATTATADAILLGEGTVTLDAYVDFLCPFCRMFEEQSGPLLDELVEEELITLAYHPLGFLDRASTTRYSTRASAASHCAEDAGRFRDYSRSLFANQPPEGGPGLSNEQLIRLGAAVGLDETFAACVTAGRYVPWSEHVTQSAIERGVAGTPTVLVDGRQVPHDPRAIAAAVASGLASST
jgi:protein-disulfide isomerase